MQNEDIGIRERKRLATKRRICDEAAALVDARGYDNVTVDDICRASGISRRTFFNYMDSKDEAVLGVFPFTCSEEGLAAIRETRADNVLDLVLRSIEVVPGAESGTSPNQACRRELIESNPGLLHAEATRRRGFLTGIAQAVHDHLERFPEDRRFDGSPEVEAHSIVGLLQVVVSLYLWHPPDGADPNAHLRNHATHLSNYAKDLKW